MRENCVERETSENLLTFLELIEFLQKVFELNNKVGIPQLFEEKKRRYTSVDFANFAEVSGTKDTKERTKLTVVIDKLKEFGKDDIKTLRTKLHPTEEKKNLLRIVILL